MHGGYYEGLGKVPGMSVINWVISYKNVVITLERSGDKRGLTLCLAELLIQFAPKDCSPWPVVSLFSAGSSFSAFQTVGNRTGKCKEFTS